MSKKNFKNMKTYNLSAPKNIKGKWTEQDDLFAKELYWLVFRKAKDTKEMRLLHHAMMENWLGREITSQDEADEWYARGQLWYQIQVNADIQHSKLRRSETKLRKLERENKTLAYDEADKEVMEKAKFIKHVEKSVLEAVKAQSANQPQPCKVTRLIPYTYKGKEINIKIEI